MISTGPYEVAYDLLGKRKDIYDTRPHLIVSGDCISKGVHSALLPYGVGKTALYYIQLEVPIMNTQWKTYRRLISHIAFLVQSPRSYRYLQDVESKQLLYDLLGSKDFVGKIHITQGDYEKLRTKAHISFLADLAGYKSTKIYRI